MVLSTVFQGMYTIEFQKRGFPHAHVLLWLNGSDKLVTTDDISRHISAELPDPLLYPNLSRVVSNFMIHGPCGTANTKSPCMKDGRCGKFFPKKFQDSTVIDEDGYPTYRRRDSGISVTKKGVQLDNRFVVPYNPHLLMKYQAHINMEYCNKSNSIKYLFKYVNKGPDRVTIQILNQCADGGRVQIVDEIKHYCDCRYLSSCESFWQILGHDIHHRWPAVQRLTFHLPNCQTCLFLENQSIQEIIKRNEENVTMFLAWMEANKKFPEERELTYGEFPKRFVYHKENREWNKRKGGFSIGKLHYVSPGTGELFYMRILLTMQKGCTTFENIRTVDGISYSSFQQACYALGLLDDDREYIDGIREASELASGHQLRKLFAMLLLTNTMNNPDVVWKETWKLLADGILYQRRRLLNIPGLFCLISISRYNSLLII